MRILGIDPGIGRLGWGVVEVQSSKVKVKNYGCIQTASTMSVHLRLKEIYNQLCDIVDKEAVEALAVEELFFNTNAKTAFVVGQARGVVLLVGAEKHLTVATYTPLQVKIAVAGYGRAEKQQVGIMVKTILRLPAIPKPDDTADALAVALTHAFSYKMPVVPR